MPSPVPAARVNLIAVAATKRSASERQSVLEPADGESVESAAAAISSGLDARTTRRTAVPLLSCSSMHGRKPRAERRAEL